MPKLSPASGPYDPSDKRQHRIVAYWLRQHNVEIRSHYPGGYPIVVLSDGSLWHILADHDRAVKRQESLEPPPNQLKLF